MTNDPFGDAVEHVPEQQRELLDAMMTAGLVTKYWWSSVPKKWDIQYTPSGREFLRLIKTVTSVEPSLRRARLLALDALAENAIAITGFDE